MENSAIEKVALLFGKIHDSSIKIEMLRILNNLDESPISFSIDYEIMIREIQSYEKKGYTFIGFFHSHPSHASTQPSKKDRRYMINWPFPYIWIIGRNQHPSDIQMFYFYEGQVYAIPFIIT